MREDLEGASRKAKMKERNGGTLLMKKKTVQYLENGGPPCRSKGSENLTVSRKTKTENKSNEGALKEGLPEESPWFGKSTEGGLGGEYERL